jgi:hypothetical protein
MTKKPNRRDLLSMGAFGALGLAFLPMLRRVARAAPGSNAKADRVLIINLTGGVRSSAAFHASTRLSHNPGNLMAGVASTVPFALGGWLDDGGDDASYRPAGWGTLQLPRLREMATEMSVLGTHSTTRGDHLRARIEEPTGSASGASPGILTRVGAGLADSLGTPAFHLSPAAQFGNALGDLTRFVPVSLANVNSVPSASNIKPEWTTGTGNGFATSEDMRDRFDARPIAERHGVGKQMTETLSFHRRAARGIGSRLAQDDFALAQGGKDTTALGSVMLGGQTPLTNGMLKSLFATGAPSQFTGFANNLALAVRLLQIGSPAVTLETPTFDFHSGEATFAPPLYGYFGRAWAALWWLLSHIPSGSGTLLDRTLVITMSDFGRDPGSATTGYNGGEGSDHGADHACFYLAHAVMGAGTRKNRLVGPVDTNTYNATQSAVRYTPQQLLVTILDALGLDPRDEEWGFPTGGAAIGELWS